MAMVEPEGKSRTPYFQSHTYKLLDYEELPEQVALRTSAVENTTWW